MICLTQLEFGDFIQTSWIALGGAVQNVERPQQFRNCRPTCSRILAGPAVTIETGIAMVAKIA